VLSKVDFGLMEVVGQFNRGFIVMHLSKIGGEGLSAIDDLFIVDQHAADEKYNFETLQATTRLKSQRLFRPRVLELTAADEFVELENMTVLQQNGFEVGLEVDQPAGRRLRLLAQPVSKNTEIDVQGEDSSFPPACQILSRGDLIFAQGSPVRDARALIQDARNFCDAQHAARAQWSVRH